ncbi:DUF294 nucleotidyltransferase-like domain-containing protein [Amycolatopsis plumensis]
MAGNQAVSIVLQRDFLDSGAAEAAFGDAFSAGALGKVLPEVNELVAQLPPRPRRWMESLNNATKHSLLHQAGVEGTKIVARIVEGFIERPPARFPDPADDAVCWRFLLEVARPNPLREGLVGRLPEWVGKLREIYAEADEHAREPDPAAFHRATEAGRRHLAEVREYVRDLETDGVLAAPQLVMSYLTRELSSWLRTLYQGAAAELGLTDYVLLAVGSVGREEMFPHSDVDYSVLVRKVTAKVAAVDALIGLQLKEMGEPDLDELSKGPPGAVAREHLVTKRDVLLDARTLHTEGRGPELENAYYAARRRLAADDVWRREIATSLIDAQSTKFSPTSVYLSHEDKDVKKGLLRLPTFIVRNLALYHGRTTTDLSVWARTDDLLEHGVLSAAVAADLRFVVDFASTLRIKLHNFYRSENETFRLAEDADPEYRGYVLSTAEEADFRRASDINRDLFARSKGFTLARSMTLGALRKAATEEAPTEAPGTGKDRDTTVRTTLLKLGDGRVAKLEEILVESYLVYQRVKLDGVEYLVESGTGVLKNDSGALPARSDENPFA